MKKSKIVFIVHRYGLDVNGGAETHCRELAERLLRFYDTEVLTSCARVIPWDNFYNPGTEVLNGVQVRRFSVEKKRDLNKLEKLNMDRLAGKEGADDEWMKESGPYCPALIEYLKETEKEYKAIIFFTYSHYLTYTGLGLGLQHTIFVPLAHDEANIYKSLYKREFKAAGAYLFNTEEEREFVCKQFEIEDKPYRVTCIGVDELRGSGGELPEKYKDYSNYVVYIGRVVKTKNYAELNKYFIEYKDRNPSDLKLLVLGRVYQNHHLIYHEDIEYLGFVSEEEKRAIVQNAKFLVLPSKTESLSFVILESFMLKRPVLVNGYCPVLVGQCRRSNAGLYYSNYEEFEAEMNFLLDHPEVCQKMGESGERFVSENYNWDFVLENIRGLIEEVGRN